ncbi:MAG: accessory factor UbiK family protein [Rhizobiaceae bacterium]
MSDNNQGPSRIFDEFAKLMTDAAGVAQGARREVEGALKGQAERFMGQMDMVHRDEFEAVKEMASRARLENAEQRKEIDALKELIGGAGKPKTKAKAASKTTAKTSATPTKKASVKKPTAKN